MMYHYNLIKINSLTTTSLFVKSFIHTTSVLSSSSTDSALRTRLGNLNEQLKLKQLESIKYEDDVSSTSISDLSITSYADSFPCLLDSAGKAIDFNKSINLFDGVKLVSEYLENRLRANKDLISDVKIGELIKPFQENKDLSVLDLLKHIDALYKTESFKPFIEDNSNVSDNSQLVLNSNSESNSNNLNDTIASSKPLGPFGDITLNEVLTHLQNAKLNAIISNTTITVNAIPAVTSFVGYSLLLKGYMKYVHNRPYEKNISIETRKFQERIRSRNLAAFVFMGKPVNLIALKAVAIPMKDMVRITLPMLVLPIPTVNILVLIY
jgi:hypothetical protein